MIRVATTREERREMYRHWECVHRVAEGIRDAYERGEERRVRTRIGGSRGYVDSVLLLIGPPPS